MWFHTTLCPYTPPELLRRLSIAMYWSRFDALYDFAIAPTKAGLKLSAGSPRTPVLFRTSLAQELPLRAVKWMA